MQDPAVDNSLYRDAMIYDILHTPGTAEELDALERIAATFAPADTDPSRRLWVEPACGSGRLVRLAARRGIPSTGFDLNEGMIAYARGRAAKRTDPQRYRVADMRTFVDDDACRPGSATFVFNTINTFRHLMTDDDAAAHLEQVRAALRTGGAYAVGLNTTMYGCEQTVEDVWSARRGSVGVTQTVQYIPPTGKHGGARIERVISHLVIDRPSGESHVDSTYALRTYSLKQWLGLIEKSPLRLIGTTDDAGHPTPPAETGYRIYVLTGR
ncbi:MAG TPA: class I SAM-dependent methyltransferase [Phycisphaerales bacterium]|nr:class I SAM-dependent methyltransferase [Phycisphaerales bacterium]